MTSDPLNTPATLIANIQRFVKIWYGPAPLYVLPPGLRLEMHPAVRIALLKDDAVAESLPFGNDPLREMFKLPVVVNMDLPEDGWRLVIVTEDVILTGTMP
jgi:hypothetical protein